MPAEGGSPAARRGPHPGRLPQPRSSSRRAPVTFTRARRGDGARAALPTAGAGAGGAASPAVVFVHGGPPRQMLLGWHYSDYYSNAYAVNQYLASRGYVVLAVNYRLGIGYGHDFHRPARRGPRGAVGVPGREGAARVPRARSRRWTARGSGSTAARTAASSPRWRWRATPTSSPPGVDIHGVHDWTSNGGRAPGDGRVAPRARRPRAGGGGRLGVLSGGLHRRLELPRARSSTATTTATCASPRRWTSRGASRRRASPSRSS